MEEAKKDHIITVGRRKEASARVYLYPGSGRIEVNKRSLEDYFPRESHQLLVKQPIKKANLVNRVDIFARIRGGGVTGQALALRHGISRAMAKFDPAKKPTLKKAGFLTRDARAKERKKYGRKRARKRFQYSKR